MRLLLILGVVLAPSFAVAQDCAGRSDLFEVIGWSAKTHGVTGPTFVTIGLRYGGSEPIKMIEAHVTATDPLGGTLGVDEMNRDTPLTPGLAFTTSLSMRDPDRRLNRLEPGEVSFHICVYAVLRDNGVVDRFADPPG